MTYFIDQHRAMQRRHLLGASVTAVAALATLSFARRTHAAADSVMRILCSGPAGSIPDLVARTVGEQLSLTLGQRVVIDDRPGAAGRLSVNALTAAPADGSTLLLAQGAIATAYPFLYDKLTYDPILDLQPVSLASEMSLGIAVGSAVPTEVATLAEFMTWLRRNPAQANFGSPGTGTLPHLLEAMLLRESGIAWQHIAYSGGPPAVTDLLGGRIAALVLPEGLLRQHHATRRIRVLATSGTTRSTYLPDVPSFVELGYTDLVVKEWFAFFAPGKTSKHTVASLSTALQQAIARPEVSATFAQAGMAAASSSPATLVARIALEQRYWKPVLQALAIKGE
jgi:tripartite-type tricarboxylate transporter receptor subunit TctC